MDIENSTLCKFKTKSQYIYHFVGTPTTFAYHTYTKKFYIFHGTVLYRSVSAIMTREQFDMACREALYNSLTINVYSN